jgi:hypothetical protein
MKQRNRRRSTHRAPRNPVIHTMIQQPKRSNRIHTKATAYRRRPKHTHNIHTQMEDI